MKNERWNLYVYKWPNMSMYFLWYSEIMPAVRKNKEQEKANATYNVMSAMNNLDSDSNLKIADQKDNIIDIRLVILLLSISDVFTIIILLDDIALYNMHFHLLYNVYIEALFSICHDNDEMLIMLKRAVS